MGWTWYDWPLIWLTNHCPAVLWHCWLGHLISKIIPIVTYIVSSGIKSYYLCTTDVRKLISSVELLVYFCICRFTDLNEHTICESLLSPQLPRQYWPIFSYNASKACNILLTGELRQQLSKRGVLCFAVHPGNVVSTGISRHWWVWRIIFALVRPFAKSKVRI